MYIRLISVYFLICSSFCSAQAANNPYGVHTMLQDFGHYPTIDQHLTWAKTLVGEGGYVKQLIYPITNSTTAPQAWWIYFANKCYDLNLTPIYRIGTEIGPDGFWKKPTPDSPGDYTTIANVIKNIVSQLPRRDGHTLYIELLNEPNLRVEWSGNPNPVEYADFLIDAATAIRSLGDSRIKILNAGLSIGGDYDNLSFIDAMCTARPSVTSAFDVWASHPYARIPPEQNYHDGTAQSKFAIDQYVLELQRLSKYMNISGLKVIGTECGYGGEGYDIADNMMRTFRDYYSKWPEVLAMCPWNFASPFGDADWIYGDSGTDANGYPTHATRQYHYVYKLAKPNMTTGGISGRVTEALFNTWLEGATITLDTGDSVKSDPRGIYMFPRLCPNTYSLTVTKPGYRPKTVSGIVVTAAQNTVVDVALQAEGFGIMQGMTLEGRTGSPISGVSIVTNPGSYRATSGADGSYSITEMYPGSYSATASKRFYLPHTKNSFELSSGQSTRVDFSLGLGGDPPSTNMIFNGEFEGSPSETIAPGWTSTDGKPHPELFLVDRTIKYAGDTCQKINATTSDLSLWQMTDYSSITAGQKYLIQVWCRTQDVVAGTNVGAGLSYAFYDNSTGFKGGGNIPGSLIGTNDWTIIRGVVTAPTGSQRLQVLVRCRGISGSAWFDELYAGRNDTTRPSAPSNITVTDPGTGGDLILSWKHAQDSDLAHVRIYRSTIAGQLGQIVYDHIIEESFRDTGLTNGTVYYYTVRSVDFAGNESTNTTQKSGIPTEGGTSTIAVLKAKPDGTPVSITSKIVTVSPNKFQNTLYIQDRNRVAGIKVYGSNLPQNVVQGQIVGIAGTLSTMYGERVIVYPEISIVSTGVVPPPYLMTNTSLGGASPSEYTPGITGASGPYNIGLLVKLIGRVTYRDSNVFYIDDGSSLSDGTGRIGVQVSITGLAPGNIINPPEVGKFVIVTGISACKYINGNLIRVLRPRDQGDIIEIS